MNQCYFQLSCSNDKITRIIHESFLNVEPGYKISETSPKVIYFPIVVKIINRLTWRVVNQDEDLINFYEVEVTVRLLEKCKRKY